MAARLTVIVSQTSVRDGRSVDLEETLVAELMMTQGLDATLIGPIESIQPDSTDFLCLSTFNHNFGFVSWLDEATVGTHWQRLGLPGTVARPGSIPTEQAVNLPKPRIYHFQIQPSQAIDDIIAEIQVLQRDRAVKTVGIGLSVPPSKARNSLPVVTSQVPKLPPSETGGPTTISPGAKPLSPTDRPSSKQPSPIAASSDDDEEEEQWQELDQLVDDLDAFEF